MHRQKYRPYNIIWHIAIRKNDNEGPAGGGVFHVIKNPGTGWLADPFLVEENEKTFIFAEMWEYKSQKGCIVCAEYKNGINDDDLKWTKVIENPRHMSYPFVWKDDKGYHMCPETNSDKIVGIYDCTDFPYAWKLEKVMVRNKAYADSTLFFDADNNPEYLFMYCVDISGGGRLFRQKIDEDHMPVGRPRFITSDKRYARCGGAFVKNDDKIFRVCQDCGESYGKRLRFMNVVNNTDESYEEKEETVLDVEDFHVDSDTSYIGVHTYNCCRSFEVIDLREYRFNPGDYYHFIKKNGFFR